MTIKRKPLDLSALTNAAVPQPDAVQLAVTPPKAKNEPPPAAKAGQPSRAQKVQIQGYFPEETRRRLKALAGREGRTVEDLLGEAIAELLTRHQG